MGERPEWWVRKDGIAGIKRFVSDHVMRAWEARKSRATQHYVPACSRCPTVEAATEIERLRAALADAELAHETYCKSWDMRKQMDRMKGALERIANEPHTPHEMKFIARAALPYN